MRCFHREIPAIQQKYDAIARNARDRLLAFSGAAIRGGRQLPLGHTKIKSTVRYQAIDIDDALTISKQIEISVLRVKGKAACLPSMLAMSAFLAAFEGKADNWHAGENRRSCRVGAG